MERAMPHVARGIVFVAEGEGATWHLLERIPQVYVLPYVKVRATNIMIAFIYVKFEYHLSHNGYHKCQSRGLRHQ